ncbi:TonB-dependent receptor [Phenylobacterium soli]|uniref:TonB-dependent receptor n=1 Tax=Phenylobacterium soli TaxID=2170551 RepID=A0A328AN49_9CAUL|nr:TonB-dependent receptor [Phenylobacterium soli]RAK55755.1 hypothetical protein DJ017_15170 [Phenylobacterium soli]
MISRTTLLATSALLAASLSAGQKAAAQDARQARPTAAGATTIEELVVTAEKRAQNLQDVPVAVSAFTSERRDLVGINTIQDLTNFTPGLAYSSGNDRIFLRGIGRLTNNLASEPGVANYNDGFYSSFSTNAALPPILVDRIEVLRGPQGTLYGRNAVGGAINIITKRPTQEFSGEARMIVGNYGLKNYQMLVSLPVNEDLRFSVGGYHIDEDGGWFHNVAGGPDEGEVRRETYLIAQMDATLGPVDVWLKYDSFQMRDRATPGGRTSGSALTPVDPSLFPPGTLSPPTGYGLLSGLNLTALGPARNNIVFQTGDVRAFSANTPSTQHEDPTQELAAHVTWHLPGMDLKYVGGYGRYFYNQISDYDNTAVLSYQVPLNPTAVCRFVPGCQPLTVRPNVILNYIEDKKFWSNEFDLASTGSGPLQWIAGLYEYEEQYHQPVYITEPDQAQLSTPSSAAPNPTRLIYYTDQFMHAQSRAAFGQVDWQASDTVKLTAGLRYTFDKKKGVEQGRLFCFGCSAAVDPRNLGTLTPVIDITGSSFSGARPTGSTLPQKGVVAPAVTDPATGIRSRRLADTWDAWTGTVGVEWKPEARTMAYAKYSRGYKAGGFNSGTIQAFPETDAEHVDAYEVGLKRDWSPTLQTNVSTFYYDYQDAQVPISVQFPSQPIITLFFNLPKVRNIGFELESTWIPLENLQLLFNYAYLDARITDPGAIQDPVTGVVGAKNNHMPLSAKNKVSLNANYTWELSGGSLNLSGSYVWRDKVYSSIFDHPWYQAGARGQIDARATWTGESKRYSVIVYGKNLTDEKDFDTVSATVQSNGSLSRTYVLVPPRTYGVELQYRF